MSALHTSEYDYEMRDLQNLFDIFGKVCCLEEIASAYCKAGCDESKAADILARKQGSSSSGESHSQFGKQFLQSAKSLDEGKLKNSAYQGKTSCGTKPKKLIASTGSVSSFLGKKYVDGISSSWNRPNVTQKPRKLEIKEPMPCGYDESSVLKSVQTNDFLEDNDVEDFLFSMLGDGFKLSRDVIRNVLGICGYDMKKICYPGELVPQNLLVSVALKLINNLTDGILSAANLKEYSVLAPIDNSSMEMAAVNSSPLVMESRFSPCQYCGSSQLFVGSYRERLASWMLVSIFDGFSPSNFNDLDAMTKVHGTRRWSASVTGSFGWSGFKCVVA